MKLTVFAREDLLVSESGVLGVIPSQGQMPRYVGRKSVPGKDKQGARFPARLEGSSYEADPSTNEGRQLMARLTKHLRRNALFADQATSSALGVPFQPHHFVDPGILLPGAAAESSRTEPRRGGKAE